jgi:streptogramin lyase
VTEYELPQLWLANHDVSGDSQGNLWWSAHRSPFVGKMDPRTGYSQEYHIPDTPGTLPGTHWISVGKNDNIWSSQNWAHKLTQIDAKTGEMRQITPPLRPNPDGTPLALNAPMGGNWVFGDDGYIWKARDHLVVKVDPQTGQYIKTWPIKNFAGTYGSALSWGDQQWFGGGAWGDDWALLFDMKKEEVIEVKTSPNQGPGRGRFDPFGAGWFGGKAGGLVRIDSKTRRVKEFISPVPYSSYYEANPDKNGEVWAGGVQDGRYVRLNPKTDRWITYVLPEPYSHNRKSWIDMSTDPVSLWYADHNGYIVHIQPLE